MCDTNGCAHVGHGCAHEIICSCLCYVCLKLGGGDVLTCKVRAVQEFVDDMRAAGILASDICSEVWFGRTGKENFGRCTTCGDLEAAIKIACQAGDAQLVINKKDERRAHYLLEKAD
eukprot:4541107-Pleurochrysis_carterae.AAC.1